MRFVLFHECECHMGKCENVVMPGTGNSSICIRKNNRSDLVDSITVQLERHIPLQHLPLVRRQTFLNLFIFKC